MKLRFLLTVLAVILTQSSHALADVPGTLPTLIQCDKLLGKSPHAVLAVLRPPDSTWAAVLGMSRTNNIMGWTYVQAGTPVNCDLIFFHKVLVVVNERRVVATANSVPSTTVEELLSQAMKVCDPTSLKLLLPELDAIKAIDNNPASGLGHMNLMITGKTPMGHALSADCDATIQGRPMIRKHSLNMDNGRYEDKYFPTQDFMVEGIFPGCATLSMGQDGYKSLLLAVGTRAPNLLKLVNGTLFLIGKGASLGVTPKNSPWFFSPPK